MNWKRISLALFILLLLMTAADGLLIRQNVQMRRLLPTAPAGLQAGAKLPSFSARGILDQPIDIRYDGNGPKRIYFYFTSKCNFCRQQFPYWKQILNEGASHNLEVIGLVKETEDKDELRRFLQQMGCSTDSTTPLKVAFISDGLRHDYGLSATPVTLLADSRGAVEKSWLGAWTDAERAEAESVLHFTITPQ